MRRIVVLFTVVALMVGMLAMAVAPAFAAWDAAGGQCRTGAIGLTPAGGLENLDHNGDGWICYEYANGSRPGIVYRFYDNRGF